MLSVCLYISLLIPPLQSPDEPSHLYRAYLLSKGEIILDHENGIPGGMINDGFLNYVNLFRSIGGDPSRKVSLIELGKAAKISWSKTEKFTGISSSIYFPLVYTPQAIAFFMGENMNFSVHNTYLLARLFALLFSISVLYYSFFLFKPSTTVIALLIIPMTIFQFGSASLDGIATSLSILSISSFLKLVNNKSEFRFSIFVIMIISMGLITTSRVHLFPILILPFIIYLNNKKKSILIISIITILLVIFWYNEASSNYFNPNSDITKQSAAIFYVTHPIDLLRIIFVNQPSSDFIEIYYKSFIGILGWLDTWFETSDYYIILLFLVLISLLSISIHSITKNLKVSFLLIFVAFSSIFTLLFIFLISNSNFPTDLIQGIQGRYFLIPFIIVGYSLDPISIEMPRKRNSIALILVLCLFVFSISNMSNLLIRRYYLNTYVNNNAIKSLNPGTRLTMENPINLVFPEQFLTNPSPIASISILFGTYKNINNGSANLVLYTPDGDSTVKTFNLSKLADNEYKRFKLDDKVYVSGRILFNTGGGISTYEAQETIACITTCMIFELTNGKRIITNGCPF